MLICISLTDVLLKAIPGDMEAIQKAVGSDLEYFSVPVELGVSHYSYQLAMLKGFVFAAFWYREATSNWGNVRAFTDQDEHALIQRFVQF